VAAALPPPPRHCQAAADTLSRCHHRRHCHRRAADAACNLMPAADDLPVLCFFWRLVTYDLQKKESDYF
jgi:hypothetical protein